ncbi:trypsin [Actinoplanes sp. SE50]|uniref:S1C family serine protease n=1 Tax=unclassified Actinoplanes TaxID=2626549 RepID=UPI00023ECE5A|nr:MULTISPECIES: trypsin-like peptidase domain-containing protein [unclassified Actinoplanes]AEV83798.1 peptidase S1 and S6 chymotrypsin/Hap [Actinoplanes sp. SE50/110]ATO82058.1 trypsin [Actinoplanes sp. SE50]SLL99466.1 trypsin [Actinoplanes sp. SE50/110]
MTEPLNRSAAEHHHVPSSFYPPVTHIPPAMVRTPADPRWKRRIAGGAAVLVLVLVGGGSSAGAFLTEQYLNGRPATASSISGTTVASTTITEGDELAPIVAKVRPSVVTVLVDGARESSLGSGVVVSADGLILTNHHVISSNGTVSVRLSTGTTVPAKVVAADPTHDLALVQATGVSGLTPVTFATDDSVAVGDTVLAFGAPLGLEGTVTSGIVSAFGRSLDTGAEKLSGLLQTDAPINEGNSGGALVDTAGRVIGINVAIATSGDSTGSVGLGFAIPADTVTGVVRQLQTRAAG